MNKFFSVGDKIGGYCNGYFGRDDYDSKICVFVNNNFAVFQYLTYPNEGDGVVLNKPDSLDKETVKGWKDYFNE